MGLAALAIFALAVLGCGQKAEQASESAGDSLLAASPVEPPQGNITPTEQFQQTEEKKTEAAPAETKPKTTKPAAPKAPSNPGVTVPAGTDVNIKVDAQITSETAQAGDAWQGTVTEPVVIGTAAPIPAGSVVHGVVKAVKPAEKGDRAMLQLAITSVEVSGKSHALSASTEQMIAGSTRTRNVGAVAGGAAAGALIGKAVGGSNKGALIGGLVGGAATAAGVAGTKGYQVVVKEGATLIFKTDDAVVMK
jgi:hypothetical protein